jgi:hypothetical protein
MWRGAINFVDNLSAKLVNRRILQRLTARAEKLAERQPGLYTMLMVGYSVLGYFLLLSFFAILLSLPGLIGTGVSFSILMDGNSLNLSPDAERQELDRQVYMETLHAIMQMAPLSLGFLTFLFLARLKARAPSGLLLHVSEGPKLFEMVDEVAKRLGTRIDKIYVTSEFNCWVG